MPIQVLPKHVADLIAAGEVVERPASVVKELCENALDAGATAVTVEIRGGGVRYIRVADNGGGIAREDARKAFLPHATSKIASAGDLESILTLGFRGEALASIAAVSKVQVLSRTAGEEHGFCYKIAAGEELSFDDAGCPVGTTFIVRDLFYNTPARMKFLKKDVTEGNFVGATLERLALSRPDVAFTFIRESKQVFQTPGDGNPGGAVRAVLGKLFYETLLGVKNAHGGVEVTGFVCEPAAARPNRNMQYFFLNGRYIKCPTTSAALGEAYKYSLMAGKFPACVLYITILPGLVDVNVHPAKTEVRFADDRPVFSAVYQSAVAALNANIAGPVEAACQPPAHSNKLQEMPLFISRAAGTPPLQPSFLCDPGEFSNPIAPERDEPSLIIKPVIKSQPQPVPQAPVCKVIGEAFSTYFLVETGNELLLVDKHAAHERIIYERLKSEQGEARRQVLLEPLPLSLSREETAALLEHKVLLEQAGFLVEEFGADAAALRECPLLLVGTDLNAQAAEIAGYLLAQRSDLTTQALDWIFHSAACRAAVKAGDSTTSYERGRFVEKLLAMPEIRHCPHGRPVIVTMTKREIEKKFGR